MANIERIPATKASAVRKRLREERTRTTWGLRKTRTKVLAVLRQMDPDAKLQPTDVKRFEGSAGTGRTPLPPVRYVEAFAEAAGVPLDYLMADDISPWPVEELEAVFRGIKADYRSRLRQPASTEEDRARDELRDKVAKTLLLASGIPLPPQRSPLGRHRDDVLAEIYVDVQILYWEAFWDRGLNEDQLLEAAMQLGRMIPSPIKLPADGFLPLEEVSEDRLRRWWLLQSEALRVLLRPSEFENERMNLGRGGELGPLSWRELIKNRVALMTTPWDNEDAIRAAVSPAKTEEEQEAEATRAKRASDQAHRKEEIAGMSPEDQKRANKEDYEERTREKKERWAGEQSQVLEDADTDASEPIDTPDEPRQEN